MKAQQNSNVYIGIEMAWGNCRCSTARGDVVHALRHPQAELFLRRKVLTRCIRKWIISNSDCVNHDPGQIAASD